MAQCVKLWLVMVLWLLSQCAWATAGDLFHVTASGAPAEISVSLCLNGTGAISCQTYSVLALDLSITTTIANHTYPAAGIKLNSPDYIPSNCTPVSNGYCLFSVSDTVTASIPVHSSHANTTLSVGSNTSVIPVNVAANSLVVTNTGAATAYNVAARFPSEWVDVTQDSSDCYSVTAGGSCTLHFSSSKPYVAATNIVVTGDNTSSPPTVAFAFSMDGYLVYAVPSNSTAQVVAQSDASTSDGLVWSTTNDLIAGIAETSTSPLSVCDGGTDGACNSQQIVDYYNTHGQPLDSYAAGLCHGITHDNSGDVSQGTWFLPAICQLNSNANSGGSDSHSGCDISTPSIYTNLYALGFLSDLREGGSVYSIGNYWTSTECSGESDTGCLDTTGYAWSQNFSDMNNAFTAPKDFALGVRCVRTMSY